MNEAIRIHTEVTGERPLGWYTGRTSEHTNRLVAEEGGFLYSADSYADELPYWEAHGERQQLIVPYTLDANDMRFATPQGFNSGDQFFAYLKDTFDTLYAEGETAPKMMSVGLHCRLVGRPGRAAALARFLDYVASHENVWVARRIDIARHWIRRHRPARPEAQHHEPGAVRRAFRRHLRAFALDRRADLRCRPHHRRRTRRRDFTPPWCRCSPRRAHEQKLALIHAHPDLAGRLKLADLTADSRGEQSSAGLDSLTEEERDRFLALNDAYRQKFGFPFIMAVKGRSKDEILAAFEERLDHETGPGVRDRHRADRADRAAAAQGAPAVARRCLLDAWPDGTVRHDHASSSSAWPSLSQVAQEEDDMGLFKFIKEAGAKIFGGSAAGRNAREAAAGGPGSWLRCRASSGSRSRATR